MMFYNDNIFSVFKLLNTMKRAVNCRLKKNIILKKNKFILKNWLDQWEMNTKVATLLKVGW